MLRAARSSGSELGKRVAAIMDSGSLVSDEIVIALIEERLPEAEAAGGAIFDGFPRTVAQAEALDHMLDAAGWKLDVVIKMQVDEDVLVDRVSGRFTCARCGTGYHDRTKPTRVPGVCDVCGSTEFTRRADDNPETLHKRLVAYNAQTKPIVPYYESKGILRRVDGMADIDTVSREIEEILAGL
jgi:adenylate kinase